MKSDRIFTKFEERFALMKATVVWIWG